MPLQSIERLTDDVTLGLWRITEQADDLPWPTGVDLSGYHGGRLVEKLVTYALLHALTGRIDMTIGYLPSGKPFVDGMAVSISHTKGWAALVLSETHNVAVDIEYWADRVSRVASRFMRVDEDGSSLASQLVCWSAKETVYKFFSDDQLAFSEMRMSGFQPSRCGVLHMDNLRRAQVLPVDYRITADYVLTWAVG